MSPWSWWYLPDGADAHGGWEGDCDTREQVIAQANHDLPTGCKFDIMEARSSTDARHEGSECVPFKRTRNREALTARLCAA